VEASPVPKFVRARPPLDDGENRKIRRLAGARHAPADWSGRARIIALSWDGLAVPAIAGQFGCRPIRCAAGCTGSTRPASTGSGTGPAPAADHRGAAVADYRAGPLGAARAAGARRGRGTARRR